MKYSRIIGTGSYLPEKVLTNQDLEKIMDTTDEWIRERTGIVKRHIAAGDETACDLAEIAASRAMEVAGKTPRQVDLIVLATTTPDRVFPSTACLLQQRLDIHGTAAFDVQAVCTGFIYAMGIADKFIRTGSARCALVVGTETLSRIVDWNDRSTGILFGDGAGAVIVKPSEEPGILTTLLCADGQYKDLLYYPVGASNQLEKAGTDEASIMMTGKEVFKVAVSKLGDVALQALESAGVSKEELDWLVPHQANIRIIQATAKRLGLPLEKVIVTVQDHGNTSAASVPMALDVGIRDGRIKPGQLVLMEAFGGGFTWGSVLMRL